MSDEPLDLGPIKARLAAASEGPWLDSDRTRTGGPGATKYDRDDPAPLDHEGCAVWPWFEEADMIFAYKAREDIPALIAEIERLRSVPLSAQETRT